MRKILIVLSSAGFLCLGSLGFSNMAFADTKTMDSTNQYTPSNQDAEKLHQKPVAQDANNGTSSDDSTQKKSKSHKMKKNQSSSSSSSGEGSTSTSGSGTQ